MPYVATDKEVALVLALIVAVVAWPAFWIYLSDL